MEEYGIPSKNFLTYRILEGDKSDNIPGVKGAGLTTIKKRFPNITDKDNYVTLKEIVEYSDKHKDELKLYESVVVCKEQLELNDKLMQLKNVDISGNARMKILSGIEKPIENYITIKAPLVGTFYKSPNPDTPPFISEGDNIKQGQILCVIEAMKIFNEIESEYSGKVLKILVKNATPVEYDQDLLIISPE